MKKLGIIKLFTWLMGILLVLLVTNIAAGIYWSDRQYGYMVVTVVIMGLAFMIFTWRAIDLYLVPKASLEIVFARLNFSQELFPTKEIYAGNYQGVPIRCEILKGRNQTNAYIYAKVNNETYIAAGTTTPRQRLITGKRVTNLPKNLTKYKIFSEYPKKARVFLCQDKVAHNLSKLLEITGGQIYWEKDQIKIHMGVTHPSQLIKSLKRGINLKQSNQA